MVDIQEWFESGRFLASIIIIALAVIIWIVIKRALNKAITVKEEKEGKRAPALRNIKTIIKYAIIVICALALFQANGINVSSLVASLGIASAVLGFAAQEFLKDMFMGLHINTDGFFQLGDVIKFRDYIGVVLKMTPQTTQIRDIYTKNIISISNRHLDVAEVLSGSVDLRIGLSYVEDYEKIHRVMQHLADTLPERVEGVKSSIYKGTSEFNDSNINYMINIMLEPEKIPQLRRNVMMEIQREFRKENIEFPFPQLDIHLDGEDPNGGKKL